MGNQRTDRPRIRRFLKTHTYMARGQLFVRSKRGFRLLATPLGISAPEKFSEYEKVFVYVTPGWWLRSFLSAPEPLSAVVVPKTFGRFGNQTLQLAHALAIAKAINAAQALCPGNEILPDRKTEVLGDVELTTTSNILSRAGILDIIRAFLRPRQSQAHLVGNFFYTTALADDLVTGESRTHSYGLIKNARSAKKHISPLPADHLVIHLRGGDAFGPQAHNEYGQPPLAFYQKIIAGEKWSAITIVTADDLNPTLPHIMSVAKDADIPVSIQSGSIDEDTNVLLSAATLVSSRSTFIPAVTAFSDNAKTVYVFGDEEPVPHNPHDQKGHGHCWDILEFHVCIQLGR